MQNQTILVLFGLTLFSLLILSFSSADKNHTVDSIKNEAIITATGIGQSLIEEINSEAFDEETVSGIADSPGSLTLSYLLGPDLGESGVSTFDDVDDYNNYTRVDTLDRLGNFVTNVGVNYCIKMSPDNKSVTRTFHKNVTVFVTNTFLSDTIKLYYTVSY